MALLLFGALVAIGAVGPNPAGATTANPSWWSGTCDATHWDAVAKAKGWTGAGAHPLGASYLGIPVCGPRPSSSGEDAPDVQWTKKGWGEYEWECTELAFRFMAQIYGVQAYEANGYTVVSHYSTADGGGLVKITNGTKGATPRPGDIISFSDGGLGHAAVVAATTVDSSGNGTLTLLSQNDTTNGWRTLSVVDSKVQSFGREVPTAWLHDPDGRGDPADKGATPPTPPPPAAATTSSSMVPFSSWDAFVAQQLVDFDGSAGTAAGRHPTDVALAAGSLAPSSYIQQHMDGAWFGGNMAPVARLYWAYFGRIPDASGLSYWTGRHRAGTSTSAISNGFAGSSEFRSTYGTLSATAFVQLVYRNVLGRAADPNGLQYWVGRLLAHTPRGSVMEGFSDSNEYTTKMTGPVDVVMMYMGLLHHAPTLVELAAGQTVSVPALIDGLRLSHAYAARVG